MVRWERVIAHSFLALQNVSSDRRMYYVIPHGSLRIRDELKRQFKCPVLDEYSSEELTRIAAQCLAGNYHVFEDINYMEVLDDSGMPVNGLGVLVGTNLHNHAMPISRMIRVRFKSLLASAAGVSVALLNWKAGETIASSCRPGKFCLRDFF